MKKENRIIENYRLLEQKMNFRYYPKQKCSHFLFKEKPLP